MSLWPRSGPYRWLHQGVKARLVGAAVAREHRGPDRRVISSYDRRKCDTCTVLSTRRYARSPRYVRVRYDPPNFGTELVRAAELEPIEESDE